MSTSRDPSNETPNGRGGRVASRLDRRLDRLRDQLSSRFGDLADALQGQMAQSASSIRTLSTRLDTLEAQLAELTGHVDDYLDDRVEEAHQKVDDTDEVLGDVLDRVADLEEEVGVEGRGTTMPVDAGGVGLEADTSGVATDSPGTLILDIHDRYDRLARARTAPDMEEYLYLVAFRGSADAFDFKHHCQEHPLSLEAPMVTDEIPKDMRGSVVRGVWMPAERTERYPDDQLVAAVRHCVFTALR